MRIVESARRLGVFALATAVSVWSCGGTHTGSASGSPGQGGSSVTGSGARAGTTGTGGSTGKQTGGGGNATNPAGCMPGMTGLQLTDCGYPTGTRGLAAVVFNESTVLEAVVPSGGEPTAAIAVFYNDEHAMTLGVRQVVVTDTKGTTTMDFPVSPLPSDPGTVTNPKLGTTMITGDYSGLDVSLRPMWPALFITDTTQNANNRAGDWQSGGVPVGPTAVFGSWKAAVRAVDKTVNPPTATITPDPDPTQNNWNLGPGADPVPAALMSTTPSGRGGGTTTGNLGFGAEARFVVSLQKGHTYRLQVMVHDGDQRKEGGDSGEACILYCAGTSSGGGGAGGSTQPPAPMCPSGVMACGGGIDPAPCAAGTTCVNGCCISSSIVP